MGGWRIRYQKKSSKYELAQKAVNEILGNLKKENKIKGFLCLRKGLNIRLCFVVISNVYEKYELLLDVNEVRKIDFFGFKEKLNKMILEVIGN